MNDFKIHCIVLTKNEADVVELCLREASAWADRIYVYDGESTDGTWEIVRRLQSKCVVPWKQDGKVFREGLRAEVFAAFRDEAKPGDWWLQLNADEFYPDDPRAFFAGLRPRHQFVWGLNVEYVLTDEDVNSLDFDLPFETIRPQLRHYRISWSEPRAFRYRSRLKWSEDAAWPRHVGLVAPERIIYKHYPYRSPSQIQMRLNVRRDNRARGFEGWAHASQEDWREKIVRAEECELDRRQAKFSFDPAAVPNHLESPALRLAKSLMHKSGLWP